MACVDGGIVKIAVHVVGLGIIPKGVGESHAVFPVPKIYGLKHRGVLQLGLIYKSFGNLRAARESAVIVEIALYIVEHLLLYDASAVWRRKGGFLSRFVNRVVFLYLGRLPKGKKLFLGAALERFKPRCRL